MATRPLKTIPTILIRELIKLYIEAEKFLKNRTSYQHFSVDFV